MLELKNISISLSGKEILKNINLKINDNEKIGIVGRNGSGKTTFLRFLMGEIDRDYNEDGTLGELIKDKKSEIGFLKQTLSDNNKNVYEYLKEAYKNIIDMREKIDKMTEELSENYDENLAIKQHNLLENYINLGGHYYEKELKRGFSKFGFNINDLDKNLSEFSGGQVTKISILKLLLSKPDILLLDEPTNHLDIDAIEWMEDYLKKYSKTVIVVSHDRMFLDNICDVIVDIENKNAIRYVGNYTSFLEQKEIRHELEIAKYNKDIKEIERLTALTDRFRYKATKASMVKSKDKIIEKIKDNLYRPQKSNTKNFHYKIIPTKEGGKDVLSVENLIYGYIDGDNTIKIGESSFNIYKGDRLAIVGKNGTGKSTLLKTIVGKIPRLSGKCKFGFDIEFEYFDQNVAANDSDKTLYEDFSINYPDLNNEEIRNRLGRFLFTGQDVEKIVKDLSGGEKVRLAFSKLFEKKPNLLILDEPTNHLDILGKESLENTINDYKGTVIFVSHDRYFTKKIANKILYFEDDKNTFFEFGYEDYEKYVKLKKGEEENKESEYVRKTRKENEKLLRAFNDAFDANQYKKLLRENPFPFDSNIEIWEDKNGIIHEENKLSDYEINKKKRKDEKTIKRLEEKIDKLETEIEELKKEYIKDEYQTDFDKLCEINLNIEEKEKQIDNFMKEWESLQNQ